jgi:ubiquinone/menaquinone biosynthesis C-methylase UbiE
VDQREVGKCWDDNADAWTHLARAGYDVCRDYLNTPLFFEMLPEVTGLQGLDIGCGEGYNTRLLAQRGATVTALDIAGKFIGHALATEQEKPLGIRYLAASALDLPFADESFDFAVGFMSFMDMPEQDRVLAEVCRVLKPGGFLQFSITHPCTDTKIRHKVRDEEGRPVAYEIGGYWDTTPWAPEWIFGDAPDEEKERWPKFKTPYFRRTISEWINAIVRTGFVVEELGEPYPSEEMLHERPDLDDMTILPFFLHLRCRKP